MLLSVINSPLVILALQLMHGFTFIVLTYSMAIYINKEVPKELKASGQALYGLVSHGLARTAGSILGGVLSDSFGIKKVFFFNSVFTFIAAAVFGIIFYTRKSITGSH